MSASPYALVTLRLASGEVVGPMNVQGAGGALVKGNLAHGQIERSIWRANNAMPLRIYEPDPGHCLMMRRHWHGDEEQRTVDLRGAVVIDVS